MVTDKEKGIVNSIEKHLPNATRLRCWNHIFRNARYWCKSHNIKNNEIQDFVTDLRELFHKPTNEDYEAHLKQLSITWSSKLCQYYLKNIHPEMYTSIGRWVLEKEGVYSPFSGVVNNQSESFNMLLEDLQQWKEVPVDCIVLSFYLLQSFFMNEITRGLSVQGNYHLHNQFLDLLEEDELSEQSFLCVNPSEIVNRIRENDSYTNNDIQTMINVGEVRDKFHNPSTVFTQLERARIILQSGKISFDSKLNLFNVLGTGNRPYVVRLFPREICSCASSGLCYHIIAVKMSIGSDIEVRGRRKVNLTTLRKRNRIRKDKKSGRKKPRRADTEMNLIDFKEHASTTEIHIPSNSCLSSEDDYEISVLGSSSQNDYMEDKFKPSIPPLSCYEDSSSQHSISSHFNEVDNTSIQKLSSKSPQKNNAAKNLLFYHKKKKVEMTILSKSHQVIELDGYNAKPNQVWIQEPCINNLKLTQNHRKILQTTSWLDDKLVDASQRFLAKQFKNNFAESGFQDVGIGFMTIKWS